MTSLLTERIFPLKTLYAIRENLKNRANILAEAQMRLQAAPFDATRVKVGLKEDDLYLTGLVANTAARRDAKALVQSIEGVNSVKNSLGMRIN